MSVIAGPGVVTSGLVLDLDAGNVRSYPGTGTTWNDLVSTAYAGTSGGMSYSSGYLTLDGVDDQINFSNPAALNINDLTMCSWFYPTANNGGYNILYARENARHFFGFDAAGGYCIFLRGATFATTSYQVHTTVTATGLVGLNQWSHVGLALAWGTSKFKVYHNGVLAWDGVVPELGASFISTASNDAVIGGRYTGNTSKFTGRMATFQYYNRALSPSEISQNFNALRGRFGL